VALDNEEAKIVIGQNVPFITGSYTNTGTGGSTAANPFQTIERKDVGITLRIKSQIGEGGTVRMTSTRKTHPSCPARPACRRPDHRQERDRNHRGCRRRQPSSCWAAC
jgi:hypothetical protein